MVYVNGKNFKIYDLDTINTFKDRLASKMSTISNYLYFPNGLKYSDIKKGNIIVEDILESIKTSAENNSSLVNLIDDVRSKLGENFNIRNKVVSIWLSYNKKLNKDVVKGGNLILENLGNELIKIKIYRTQSEFLRDYKNRKNQQKDLEEKIKFQKNDSDNMVVLFEEFDSIDEPAISMDFNTEYMEFILNLDISDISSILDLFNSIVLTEIVPFATTHNFYKILTDYIPPEEWSNISENYIILKVNQKEYITVSSNASNYLDVKIMMDSSSNEIDLQITINIDKGNVSKDVFVNRVLNVFKYNDVNIKSSYESKIVGTFYYPKQTLDKYIFSDLVMNDDIVKNLINIDEHEKATKKKQELYIHFNHPSTGYITATISEKIMKKNDPSMKNQNPDIFPVGQSYIRVKITKADNSKSVEKFKDMLGKILIIYDEKYNEIRDFYKQYIPEFGNVIEYIEEDTQVIKLSKEVQEIFGIGGFYTYCEKKRTPTIISEEKASELKEEGKSVIKFPREIPDDPNITKYPSDGQNSRYYTCNHKIHPYIGIQKNNLKNSDNYPYVPCCFKRDQQKKPRYQHYYQGKEIKQIIKKQHNIISTDKILDHDQYGTLPPNIENLFNIINSDPTIEYVRRGIGVSNVRNVNSFINAVMEALNDETNILSIEDKDELEVELIDQRNMLANENIAPLCRQELYDMSVQKIISIIKDNNVYFDPKLFLHLLEHKFDCNIILFTKKILDGEMTLPRHLQAYYKNKNKNRFVYIFEHMGSNSDDKIKYPWPQCELIVRYNTKTGETQDSFSFDDKDTINIKNVYSLLTKSYALDSIIKETYLPININDPNIKIKSQWIDSYGKTRRLNIKYKNNNISLITSPIQPINVKETKQLKIYTVDLETVKNISNYLGIKINSQTIIEDTIKEVNGILGNVTISIPVKDKITLSNVPKKYHGLSYTDNQISDLEQYNRNKKLARYIVEYTLWLYSKYLKDQNIVDINDQNISNFAKNFFTINPNYKYNYIIKTFTKDSPLLKNGKIVVDSEETIKRLLYVLRLNIQRNKDTVLQYHLKSVIYNYYVDITDFKKYDHQVILFGEESVSKWISENNIKYFLYDEIQIGSNTPYFFKNNLIDSNIHIAQNTTSLEKAIDIAITWKKHGYNPNIHAKNHIPVSFTLYSYQNSSSIKKIEVKGKSYSEKIKIIGYKIDNTPFYTTLLSL
jgi:hypothetical protein